MTKIKHAINPSDAGQHGGKRSGAGRPLAEHGATTTIRVPLGCLSKVKAIIDKFKKSFK